MVVGGATFGVVLARVGPSFGGENTGRTYSAARFGCMLTKQAQEGLTPMQIGIVKPGRE